MIVVLLYSYLNVVVVCPYQKRGQLVLQWALLIFGISKFVPVWVWSGGYVQEYKDVFCCWVSLVIVASTFFTINVVIESYRLSNIYKPFLSPSYPTVTNWYKFSDVITKCLTWVTELSGQLGATTGVLATTAAVFIVLYNWQIWDRHLWPPGPMPLPFVGNMLLMARSKGLWKDIKGSVCVYVQSAIFWPCIGLFTIQTSTCCHIKTYQRVILVLGSTWILLNSIVI